MTLTLDERLALHRRMAEAYRNAYLRQGIQEGEAFVDVWKFAADAMYASPYFTGDQAFLLSEFPEESARASTMEAGDVLGVGMLPAGYHRDTRQGVPRTRGAQPHRRIRQRGQLAIGLRVR
jgi:hypothetical protein